MKNFISVILFTLIITRCVSAQWEQMPGPRGMKINVFYKNNNFIFAGTKAYGVFRSSNNGTSWEPANTGIEHTFIYDFVSSGNNLLTGVGSNCGLNNVYKSTDNGMHWKPTSGLANKIALSFAIKGPYIYTATTDFNSSIYRSSDNGETWQQVPSPIQYASKVFVSGDAIIVSEFNFIWRSIDEGASWKVAEQFALSGVWSYAKCGNKLFGAGLAKLYTSTNDGESWDYSIFPGGAYSLSSVGNTIYLGNGKVSKSTDAGTTWTTASTGLGIGEIAGLLYDSVRVYASANNDTSGVYITTNGGASWYPSSNGFPPGSTIRSMISLGSYVFTGMQADGVYRSGDDGYTWSKTGLNNDSLSQLVLSFCTKNGDLYAGSTNGVYKSTDAGLTFSRTVIGFPGGGSISIHSLTVSNGNIIASGFISYIGDTSSVIVGIYYSTNNGTNWNQSSFPAISNFISSVASDGSSTVFAGSYGNNLSTNGLYKSTNAGVTWMSRTFSYNADIDILAVNGQNVLAANLFGSSYSLDGGNTFLGSSMPGGGTYSYTIKNNIIFAGNQYGMFYSTNSGQSYLDANSGFTQCPRPSVEASCANDQYLFAGTDLEGVWRRPLSDFGISGINISGNEIPDRFQLFQNYPNPFNPETKIKFEIPFSSNSTVSTNHLITIKIFDLTGKEIATLINENLVPGKHEVNWDASGFPSGTYFYTLSGKNFKQTKKMILLK